MSAPTITRIPVTDAAYLGDPAATTWNSAFQEQVYDDIDVVIAEAVAAPELPDTNASHALALACASNLTADRILSFAPGDASRTLTLSGNPTLGDWFDQAVKAASTPAFNAIVFPAVQVPSANANTLDDYEEAPAATATLVCGTSGTITVDPSFNKLDVTKVGREVTVTGYIGVSAVSSPVGTLTLNGLPFAMASTTQRAGWAAVTIYAQGLAAGVANVMARITSSAPSSIEIVKFAGGTTAALAGDVQVGTVFVIQARYFTST